MGYKSWTHKKNAGTQNRVEAEWLISEDKHGRSQHQLSWKFAPLVLSLSSDHSVSPPTVYSILLVVLDLVIWLILAMVFLLFLVNYIYFYQQSSNNYYELSKI